VGLQPNPSHSVVFAFPPHAAIGRRLPPFASFPLLNSRCDADPFSFVLVPLAHSCSSLTIFPIWSHGLNPDLLLSLRMQGPGRAFSSFFLLLFFPLFLISVTSSCSVRRVQLPGVCDACHLCTSATCPAIPRAIFRSSPSFRPPR